jgi:Fe-S cluster assembly protein SufD
MITPTAYREALSHIDAPNSFAAARQAALNAFLKTGLPESRQEDWRYISLDHLERMPLHAPEDGLGILPALEDYPGALLAYLDDHLVWQDTSLPTRVLDTLEKAIGDGMPAWAADTFGSLAGTASLTQLNAALWREGACLRVLAGERLRQPVFLRFAAAEADAMLYPRVFVHMAVGADAILVEHFLGDPGIEYWQNPVTEIVLEAGARLTHLRIIEDSNLATHTGLTAVYQASDSSYRALNLTLSGQVARHELNLALAEAGAEARLDGVFIAAGRSRTEQHLRIAHQAPHGSSRTLYRGLAEGRGRGVFDARVEVQAHAYDSDAQQSSRNLLLSPHAEIDAKPQLEIYTDDVKCSHAATVGSLDEDALFYLRSRGIDGDHARRLLMQAFVDEALGLLDDTGLRDWLMPRLLAGMPRGQSLEPREWTH